ARGGLVGARQDRRECGCATWFCYDAQRTPKCRLRLGDRGVGNQHGLPCVICTIGNTCSPTRRGASESAARPPASASTGRPASKALVSVGDASGSTPITLIRPAYQAATPAISPPPPTDTSSVSISGP